MQAISEQQRLLWRQQRLWQQGNCSNGNKKWRQQWRQEMTAAMAAAAEAATAEEIVAAGQQ